MEEKTKYGTIFALIFVAASAMTISGCGKSEPEKPACQTVDLSDDIMPIIQANCAVTQCHLDARSPILATQEDVLSNADRIRASVAGQFMPPPSRTPLSAEDIEKIKCWADNL